MGVDGVLRAVFGVEVDNGIGPRALSLEGGDDVFKVFGDAVKFLGADDEVEVGQAVEQVGAAVLGHTAHHADDEVGLSPFAGGDMAGFTDGFLLGLFAHAAGIQEDDVGVGLALDDAVPLSAEHGGDGFRISFVHLAAVGLDEYPVHRNELRCGAWAA